MSVTIKDIAVIARVTHSTVSRCLNGKPGVSSDVCEEIKKIASELGFEFNANARGLNTKQTGTIGIILEEDLAYANMHSFTNAVLSKIRCSLEKEDLDMLLSYSRNSYSRKDNIVRMVNRKKIDGLILLCSSIKKETVDFLKNTGTPFVFAHQIPKKFYGKVNAVYTDHRLGGLTAVKHLIEKGRSNILCVCRPEEKKEFRLRTKGYIQALEENDISLKREYIVTGGYDWSSASETVELFSPFLNDIDGIFAHTDLIAVGLLRELTKLGIRIPEDIAIVGYDNIELCTFVEPMLTTVNQPVDEISDKACSNLLRQLEGGQASEHELIKPNIVIRETT